MRKILSLLIFALLAASGAAQELNCHVEVNSDKITGTNKSVFTTLQEAITSYMNDTKFTAAQYSPIEKIECTLFFTIKEYDGDKMTGDIQVQATRPAYNASYTTNLINFRDSKVEFTYSEGEPLTFKFDDVRIVDANEAGTQPPVTSSGGASSSGGPDSSDGASSSGTSTEGAASSGITSGGADGSDAAVNNENSQNSNQNGGGAGWILPVIIVVVLAAAAVVGGILLYRKFFRRTARKRRNRRTTAATRETTNHEKRKRGFNDGRLRPVRDCAYRVRHGIHRIVHHSGTVACPLLLCSAGEGARRLPGCGGLYQCI